MRHPPIAFLLIVFTAACSRDTGESTEQLDYTAASGGAVASAPPPAAAPHPSSSTGALLARQSREAGKARAAAADMPVISATAGLNAGTSAAMLIRTGNAAVEVRDLAKGIAAVRSLAAQLGGYVANTAVVDGRDQVKSATLELKIPAAQFDRVVNGLEPLGRVESVNVDAQDVGEEYVDVSARVANAKRLEERLVALLATRTGRLEDVLAVERELARVREEIERYAGRLRYLEARTAMSTITITIHEPYPVLGRPTDPIAEAFRDAWRNAVAFVAWLIAAMGVLVPAAVIGGGAYMAGRRVWKARAA